jgi:uncharacterized protein (DUF427 family)
MSVRMSDLLAVRLADLRYEPTAKHVRAELDGVVVMDSDRALLVWEPRRVVATYAVPVADVHGEPTDPLRRPGRVSARGSSGQVIPLSLHEVSRFRPRRRYPR